MTTDILKRAARQLEAQAPFLWLYEVEVPGEVDGDPPRRFRLVNARQEIEYAVGNASVNKYFRWPIFHDGIEENSQSEKVAFNVTTVLDRNGEIVRVLDKYNGLLGQKVTILFVSMEQLDNSTANRRYDFRIEDCEVQASGAVIMRFSTDGLYDQKTPSGIYSRGGCGTFLGSDTCGYIIPAGATNEVGGGFSSCPRLLNACRERGEDEAARGLTVLHPRRFDAFPGMLVEPVE